VLAIDLPPLLLTAGCQPTLCRDCSSCTGQIPLRPRTSETARPCISVSPRVGRARVEEWQPGKGIQVFRDSFTAMRRLTNEEGQGEQKKAAEREGGDRNGRCLPSLSRSCHRRAGRSCNCSRCVLCLSSRVGRVTAAPLSVATYAALMEEQAGKCSDSRDVASMRLRLLPLSSLPLSLVGCAVVLCAGHARSRNGVGGQRTLAATHCSRTTHQGTSDTAWLPAPTCRLSANQSSDECAVPSASSSGGAVVSRQNVSCVADSH
jgi:hypothetical protein